jgi:hypothetical protein
LDESVLWPLNQGKNNPKLIVGAEALGLRKAFNDKYLECAILNFWMAKDLNVISRLQ